jgi:hypothetical protein
MRLCGPQPVIRHAVNQVPDCGTKPTLDFSTSLTQYFLAPAAGFYRNAAYVTEAAIEIRDQVPNINHPFAA